MIKLGTPVTDKASGLEGMLVHMQVQSSLARFYNFQPRGLNPETGAPLKRYWITPDRVIGGIEIPDPALPLAALGTQATDNASGFHGTVTAITLHINGCVHASICHKGVQPKSGEAIDDQDFDLRLLTGPAIPVFTEAELEKSHQEKPSPMAAGACGPRPM